MKRRRKAVVAWWILLVLLAVAPEAAAQGYPDPPLNFAHGGAPHAPYFSEQSGNTSRPHLVIMVSFKDRAMPSDVTPAVVASRAFAENPFVTDTSAEPFSVFNYYNEFSRHNVSLAPALESDTSKGGAVNDGVVSVKVDKTVEEWQAMGMDSAAQNRLVLEKANDFVAFNLFDRPLADTGIGDDKVDREELLISRIDAEKGLAAGGSGALTRISGVNLDGKDLSDQAAAFIGSGTNLRTWIHEIAHVAFGLSDFYGQGVGSADIMGPTAAADDKTLDSDDEFFLPSTWHAMHLGWLHPTVVSRDGYYDVPPYATTGQSFLLYDYDRGPSDYFLIENRSRPSPLNAARYDTFDPGLAIFQVDESKAPKPSNDDERPLSLQAPLGETATDTCFTKPDGRVSCCPDDKCYGGSSKDAWDPSDPSTPPRAMDARPWQDGTASRLAVRAIPRQSESMRVFFDVRGPGVLIDSYRFQAPDRLNLNAGETTTAEFPVRNTGETLETFLFGLESPPRAGSSPQTDRRSPWIRREGRGSPSRLRSPPPIRTSSCRQRRRTRTTHRSSPSAPSR